MKASEVPMDYLTEVNSVAQYFNEQHIGIQTPEGDILGDEPTTLIVLNEHLPLPLFRIFVMHELCNLLFPVEDPSLLCPNKESYLWYTLRKYDVDSATLIAMTLADMEPELFFDFLALAREEELESQSDDMRSLINSSFDSRERFARSYVTPGPAPDPAHFIVALEA